MSSTLIGIRDFLAAHGREWHRVIPVLHAVVAIVIFLTIHETLGWLAIAYTFGMLAGQWLDDVHARLHPPTDSSGVPTSHP